MKSSESAETTTFIAILIDQIAVLASDRRLAREVNGFIRYQLAGLVRGLIDCEIGAKGISTPDADLLVAEIQAAINGVAKKTEDKDTAALLRRFTKILENDYACVRSATMRRARA